MKIFTVIMPFFFSLNVLATPDAFLFGACVNSLHEEFADSEVEVKTLEILSETDFYATISYELALEGKNQCFQASVIVKDCKFLSQAPVACIKN